MFKFLTHVLQDEAPSGDESGGGQVPAEKPVEEQPSEQPQEQPKGNVDEKPKEDQEAPKKEEGDLPEVKDKSTLEQVKGLVSEAGLDIVELAKYAKENEGQISLEDLVTLKEKHGDAVASLLVEQIKNIHTTNKAAADKRDKAVYDQVAEAFKDVTDQSGEETWKELATWSKENISDVHRAAINKLLGMGGLATQLAVQELTSAFKDSQGTQEFQDVDLMEADRLDSNGFQPLSKSDYVREQNELLAKGHVYGDSAELAKLDNRRARTLKR